MTPHGTMCEELTAPRISPFGFYTVDLFDCPSFKMFTAGDCPRAENILLDRKFEPESMRLWCKLVRAATSILDIGAHVGVYSLAAASLRSDIPVHAFEPNPEAYSRLRVHRRINGFDNIVEHRYALADKTGTAAFSWYVKPEKFIASGAGLGIKPVKNSWGVESVFVTTKRLDEVAIDYGSQPLVKIDVEGAERHVLEGAQALLATKPDIILESFSQKNCDLISEMLRPGYSVFRIHECGEMNRLSQLTAADLNNQDFNQFITWAH